MNVKSTLNKPLFKVPLHAVYAVPLYPFNARLQFLQSETFLGSPAALLALIGNFSCRHVPSVSVLVSKRVSH